ncbi:energy transducer TonB [Luteimonas sp. MHLX1A]|uniref:energy transducer TonB n=1 Tax=Alterluteimonas muca TaxID=2878684 RepID=UPI001E56A0C0|nr:energy transducer TonB [Luteimonas sp. MHLX1A]MCD9047499.1 energy transducer TonB [Luteimonas sp. MHLX1A]
MAHRYASGAVLLLALACLSAGCGRGPEPAASTTAPVTDGGIDAHGDVQGLRRRAHAALEARRLHAPAGDNAAEHFLEVQRQAPDDTAAREALVALQPYVMIAAEQALARGDAGEAKRLTALLERIDPAAPSLPRLAAGLATLAAAPPRPAVRAPDDAGAETASTAVAGAAAVGVAAREAPVATAPVETATAAPPGRAAAVASPAPAPPMAVPVAAEAGTGVAARGGPSPAPPSPTPALLEDATPRYPMIALNRRLEGRVQIAFTIDPEGRVRDPRVTASDPQGVFDRAALTAAERWRFEATGRVHTSTRTLQFSLD